jgi:putative glutamine amidotransferase
MALITIAHGEKVEDYRQSILHVGGEVRLVDGSGSVAAALDGADGVLLSGGEDVSPGLYGEEPVPALGTVNAARDAFEMALIAETRRRGLPILGICRGIQALNVACGGSLVQDIAAQVPGAMPHVFKVPEHESYYLAHELWLEKDSLLERLMRERLSDSEACEVNSRHHQAIKRVADGFIVSATAPDGIVEAIEDPSARFCMGLQWHPENFWRTGEFRPIFEGFLLAASKATA